MRLNDPSVALLGKVAHSARHCRLRDCRRERGLRNGDSTCCKSACARGRRPRLQLRDCHLMRGILKALKHSRRGFGDGRRGQKLLLLCPHTRPEQQQISDKRQEDKAGRGSVLLSARLLSGLGKSSMPSNRACATATAAVCAVANLPRLIKSLRNVL